MKEILLDVIKWGLILVIAGAVFYEVCPKYYFDNSGPGVWTRGNKINGKIEVCIGVKDKWQELGKYKHTDVFDKAERDLEEKGRYVFEDEKTEPKP